MHRDTGNSRIIRRWRLFSQALRLYARGSLFLLENVYTLIYDARKWSLSLSFRLSTPHGALRFFSEAIRLLFFFRTRIQVFWRDEHTIVVRGTLFFPSRSRISISRHIATTGRITIRLFYGTHAQDGVCDDKANACTDARVNIPKFNALTEPWNNSKAFATARAADSGEH